MIPDQAGDQQERDGRRAESCVRSTDPRPPKDAGIVRGAYRREAPRALCFETIRRYLGSCRRGLQHGSG